jgi:transposase-like protein
MKRKRTYRTKEIKFKVALEAIKEQKQISEIAEEYNVHPNQVTQWKKELLEKGADVFALDKKQTEKEIREQQDKLYKKVGEQQMHIDWLKKTLGITG